MFPEEDSKMASFIVKWKKFGTNRAISSKLAAL